jgi:rod shape-determining protein MreD
MRLLFRSVLVAAAVLLAIAVEFSVLPHAHLPAAEPDLVLLTVLAFATVWGRTAGAVTGFLTGLTLDLAPPSTTAVGRHAIVLTLVGALAGRAAREMRRSALRASALAGLYALAAVLANALLGSLIGDGTGLARSGLITAAAATALYTAIATPLVMPGLAALARRVEGSEADVLAPVGNALDPHPVRGYRPENRQPAAARPALRGGAATLSAEAPQFETVHFETTHFDTPETV